MSLTNDEKLITVCAECKMACCWQGIFMCDDAVSAGVIKISIGELRKLGFEHPSYWMTDEELFFRQYPRYLPEPISYEVALDLLRDRGISLNSPGRVRQILGWFGDTDNVRRAIETVRGEQK